MHEHNMNDADSEQLNMDLRYLCDNQDEDVNWLTIVWRKFSRQERDEMRKELQRNG